jgi:formate dehydrogenase subunit gamma
MSVATSSTDRAFAVRRIAESHKGERGAVLPILHEVVAEVGWVTHEDTKVIADVLNLAEAEVYGTATFYKDFKREPSAPCTVQICRAEACQAVGAEALAEHAKARLNTTMDARSADGAVELEQIFCFGNCALGPTVAVDGRLHGRVTPERLDTLIEEARS